MIAFVEGKVEEIDPTFVTINVGGVGYQIFISLNTYSKIKSLDKVRLETYLHVREDAQLLYGFKEKDEKDIFLMLISISGVGAATGLMVLSSMSPKDIRTAILNDDVNRIKSVKGIGAKTAQRIILELRDKLGKQNLDSLISDSSTPQNNSLKNEALSALTTLGINRSTAEKNIDSILKTHGDHITLEELIKSALRN